MPPGSRMLPHERCGTSLAVSPDKSSTKTKQWPFLEISKLCVSRERHVHTHSRGVVDFSVIGDGPDSRSEHGRARTGWLLARGCGECRASRAPHSKGRPHLIIVHLGLPVEAGRTFSDRGTTIPGCCHSGARRLFGARGPTAGSEGICPAARQSGRWGSSSSPDSSVPTKPKASRLTPMCCVKA
jgi:hypothetical protein